MPKVKIAIIKIGTDVVQAHPTLLPSAVQAMVAREVGAARQLGWSIVEVVSGAIAEGRRETGTTRTATSVGEDQWLASMGQGPFFEQWREAHRRQGIRVGQVLVTHRDLATRRDKQRLLRLFQRHFAAGTVPIVNENDSVTDEEIRTMRLGLSDNDDLAYRLAKLVGAQAIIFLTKSGGVYKREPTGKSGEKQYAEIAYNASPEELGVKDGIGKNGRGGIKSKILFAQACYREGTHHVAIAGLEDGIMTRFLRGDRVGTIIGRRTRP